MQDIFLAYLNLGWLLFHFSRAEGSEAAQLAEIYAKLEEIEADKAPARYLKFPFFIVFYLSFLWSVPTGFLKFLHS